MRGDDGLRLGGNGVRPLRALGDEYRLVCRHLEFVDLLLLLRMEYSPEGLDYGRHGSPEGLDYDGHGSPEGLDYDGHGSPKGLDYDGRGRPKGLDYDRQGNDYQYSLHRAGSGMGDTAARFASALNAARSRVTTCCRRSVWTFSSAVRSLKIG